MFKRFFDKSYFWQKTIVSLDQTHHIFDQKPLYKKKFRQVLKFHAPGLAPVQDISGSWYHINTKGNPAYSFKYHRVFGFYENLAAVETSEGCFHIKINGRPAYEEKYKWCGNFQEGLCVVQNKNSKFFHINQIGKRIYDKTYKYAGDFKDGFAVVHSSKGATHIDKNGQYLHRKWFDDLDVYHKGFAKAKGSKGWFHIDLSGQAAYQERYKEIEPFYNGRARVLDHFGSIKLINEAGEVTSIISKTSDSVESLTSIISSDMVGFWKTWILKTAADLEIFNILPATSLSLSQFLNVPQNHIHRLMRGLWELGYVEYMDKKWQITNKGKLLRSSSKSSLVAAPLMWAKVNEAWMHLTELISNPKPSAHLSFKQLEQNAVLRQKYLDVLDTYNDIELNNVFLNPLCKQNETCFIGRASLPLIRNYRLHNPKTNLTLLGDEFNLSNLSEFYNFYQVKLHPIEFLKFNKNKFDVLIFTKYLHYFPDKEALHILTNGYKSLKRAGKIYVIEMILEDQSPTGSLLDLNMLAETNGHVRTLHEWQQIAEKCRLIVRNQFKKTDLSSVLVLEK
ncbi:MAG: hypothetical protein CMM87_00090 [Rickettsiales bacterium]|nr:hypothetical protein [Rickettsiales bacterium]|tara:strand:+ start:19276 stop:20967 length:1692 start_codon:yes stop_codon:yes gene_type:complete